MLAETHPITRDEHHLVFESPTMTEDGIGTTWEGFFKPPADGEYRFYISCAEGCALFMDKENSLESG